MKKKTLLLTGVLLLTGCSIPAGVFLPKEGQTENFFNNLVPNASFESGNDRNVSGWEGSGCKIKPLPHSGSHALYLTATAGKKAKCKTVPFKASAGHHDFSLWLKTKGLKLNKERRLSDALSVKLYALDKRGNKLSTLVPYNSSFFNAFDFATVTAGVFDDRQIEPLGYTRVHLMPQLYSFDYGWLPKRTEFAVIDITLTGPGEVWIDDINLFFTLWNSPLKIRLESERKAKTSGLDLIPTPEKAAEVSEPLVFAADSNNPICLLVRKNNGSVYNALYGFRGFLEDHKIDYEIDDSCQRYSLVIAPGIKHPAVSHALTEGDRNLLLSKRYKEGYIIKPFQYKSGSDAVSVTGGSLRGLFYGLDTLSKLFVLNPNGTVTLRRYEIYDYPKFMFRAVSAKDQQNIKFADEIKAARWLPETRLNALFLEVDTHNLMWWNPTPDILRAAESIGDISKQTGLFDFGILINPYIHYQDSRIKWPLEFSNPDSVRIVWSVIRRFMELGATRIILRMDDFPPRDKENRYVYVLESSADIKRFKTLVRAHAFFADEIFSKIKKLNPKASFYFVPPYYNLRFVDAAGDRARDYLTELGRLLPKKAVIMWTGPSIRSLAIDKVHLSLFSDLSSKRQPLLWDNTLYVRRHRHFWGRNPGRVQLNSFLEPFSVQIGDDLFSGPGLTSGIFLNAQATELFRIQLASAGALMWSGKGYRPYKTLLSYLKTRYGERGAELLIELDYIYWQIRQKELQSSGIETTRLKEQFLRKAKELRALLPRLSFAPLLPN